MGPDHQVEHQEGDCASRGTCRLCRTIGGRPFVPTFHPQLSATSSDGGATDGDPPPLLAAPRHRRRPSTNINTSDMLRERKHGLLWFGTEKDQWNITDPSSAELYEACSRLRPDFAIGTDRTPEEKQHDSDLYRVLRCVEDYQHLTTYPLGIEHIIKKLRVIWRALRRGA